MDICLNYMYVSYFHDYQKLKMNIFYIDKIKFPIKIILKFK